MFEKVSRSLKYDSKYFFVLKHVDTNTDHCVRGNMYVYFDVSLKTRTFDKVLWSVSYTSIHDTLKQ